MEGEREKIFINKVQTTIDKSLVNLERGLRTELRKDAEIISANLSKGKGSNAQRCESDSLLNGVQWEPYQVVAQMIQDKHVSFNGWIGSDLRQ